MEAYSSFSSTGSDHRIVSSKVRISLITGLFLKQKSHCKIVTVINNRFHFKDDEDISEAYERFIKANSEVASELVPIKPKKVNICPFTDKTVIKTRQATYKAYT